MKKGEACLAQVLAEGHVGSRDHDQTPLPLLISSNSHVSNHQQPSVQLMHHDQQDPFLKKSTYRDVRALEDLRKALITPYSIPFCEQ